MDVEVSTVGTVVPLMVAMEVMVVTTGVRVVVEDSDEVVLSATEVVFEGPSLVEVVEGLEESEVVGSAADDEDEEEVVLVDVVDSSELEVVEDGVSDVVGAAEEADSVVEVGSAVDEEESTVLDSLVRSVNTGIEPALCAATAVSSRAWTINERLARRMVRQLGENNDRGRVEMGQREEEGRRNARRWR